MHNWFLSKVTYDKMLENGLHKKVTEQYLVDALSFTEAEARTIEELNPLITGEFTVSAVGRAKISEIFYNENGDKYYKVKVFFVTLDEKTGIEKYTAAHMISQASDIKDAIKVFEEGMKGTLSDYVIASVTETHIIDIFEFDDSKVC